MSKAKKFFGSEVGSVAVGEGQATVVVGTTYRLSATTDLWWANLDSGAAAITAGGANTHFLGAGRQVEIIAVEDEVRFIRDSADGSLSISVVQ